MTNRLVSIFALAALSALTFSATSAFAVKGHGKDDGPKEELLTKGPDAEVYHYSCEGELVKIKKMRRRKAH